jgi:hypothetical protein
MSYLPKPYSHMTKIFEPKTAVRIPPLRGPKIDYQIKLEKDKDRKEKELP